jgi:uncharacterized protein (TIGR03086 family)
MFMSQNLRRVIKAAYSMDAVVQRFPLNAWDQPSPCELWNAREVLGHVIWGMQNITAMALVEPRPADRSEADVAGEDPAATWQSALDSAIEALDRPGSLSQYGDGPWGQMTVDDFLGFYPSDVLAHTWDLAQAGRLDAHLPIDLCERGADGLAAAGDAVRGPGLLGPVIECAADADVATRFLSLAGRHR